MHQNANSGIFQNIMDKLWIMYNLPSPRIFYNKKTKTFIIFKPMRSILWYMLIPYIYLRNLLKELPSSTCRKVL